MSAKNDILHAIQQLVWFNPDRPVWWRAIAMVVVVMPAMLVLYWNWSALVIGGCAGLLICMADDWLWPIVARNLGIEL